MTTAQIAPVQIKRSRADVYRSKVQIRLALDEAGPEIGKLLAENGVVLPGVTWGKVFPHWLIATAGDQVIGCLQIMPVKPIGRCEFLYVRKSAGFKERAIAIRKLMVQGIATCHAAGCAYVAGVVDLRNKKFENVLAKLNFARAPDHMVLVKRLVD